MNIPGTIKSFTYLGGKASLLPWLLPLLETGEQHFIDVFGGSAAVLLNRQQRPIETYNDINRRVVNFFKVLREDPEELIFQLEMTMHSRAEYDDAWDATDDEIENARRFFIRTNQSSFAAGAQTRNKGWSSAIRESRCKISEKTNKWLSKIEGLPEVYDRLRQVQIECRDFRWIISKYDAPGVLFYCDPPYTNELRSDSKYEFDFRGQDHVDLQHHASRIQGKIAISGYETESMRDLFKGFYFTRGPQRKNSQSDKIALEGLWTNYKPNE